MPNIYQLIQALEEHRASPVAPSTIDLLNTYNPTIQFYGLDSANNQLRVQTVLNAAHPLINQMDIIELLPFIRSRSTNTAEFGLIRGKDIKFLSAISPHPHIFYTDYGRTVLLHTPRIHGEINLLEFDTFVGALDFCYANYLRRASFTSPPSALNNNNLPAVMQQCRNVYELLMDISSGIPTNIEAVEATTQMRRMLVSNDPMFRAYEQQLLAR